MSYTLLNMNCMEFMRNLPDNAYSLAIVDPPYGIGNRLNIDTWNKKIYPNSKNKHKTVEWNNNPPNDKYFKELIRISINQIIWGGNYFKLPISRGWIFWDKVYENTFNFSAGELAWTSFDKILKKFTKSTRNSEKYNIHPAQKPVKLYEWLLTNYAKPGDRILDTHGGSMSSVIACINLGFDITCIELDKDYFEAAKQRIENHQKQPRMFNLSLSDKPTEQTTML